MLVVVVGLSGMASADDGAIIVQSTTSTQNSGLYEHILPIYKQASGQDVRVIAVGTGQAIKNAKNCDGDVLLVHSTPDELQFVADGFGLERHDLMYNDFVLIGPRTDPAKVRSEGEAAQTLAQALGKIAQAQHRFISRGDDSGTHKAEVSFWQKAEISTAQASGAWYLETGQGMGGTLNITIELDAYTISDRSTWAAFGNRQDHQILFQGDPDLLNQYGLIVVSQAACPSVKAQKAAAFAEWMQGAEGQAAIASYRVDDQQLFFPNAQSDE